MRFSLKWILVSMAYAVLSAAALTQDSWAYADALWAATLVAVAYSILIAIVASGKSRATAAGFAVFAISFLACLVAAPESVPSQRMLAAAGVEIGDTIIPVTSPGPSATAAGVFTSSTGNLSYSAPLSVTMASPPNGQVTIRPNAQAFKMISGSERIAPKLRAVNASGTMLFGIIGVVLGSYAWRRVKSETSA